MPKEIEQIKALAAKLPSGLTDHRAFVGKMDVGMFELKEAMDKGDRTSIALKGSNVCLLAIRAEMAGLITEDIMRSWIELAASLAQAPSHILLRYCVVKLSRNEANSPMNWAAERQAITHMLWSFFIEEAQSIRYLIIKSGGMATKSRVEDVLMARHQGMNRGEAHGLMNWIEFMNEDWFRIGNPSIWTRSDMVEPKLEDYPEIMEALR